MKFNFRLESVLKHRARLQEEAQLDYAEAENNVRLKMEEIKGFYKEIENARIMRSESQSGSEFVAMTLSAVEEFIKLTEVKIDRAKHEARELMQVMEEKHQILVEKARDKKVLDRLKEKKFVEFKKDLKRIETKVMDEIAMFRSYRGVNYE